MTIGRYFCSMILAVLFATAGCEAQPDDGDDPRAVEGPKKPPPPQVKSRQITLSFANEETCKKNIINIAATTGQTVCCTDKMIGDFNKVTFPGGTKAACNGTIGRYVIYCNVNDKCDPDLTPVATAE